MNKTLKRAAALLLAMAMVFGLSAAAFAAPSAGDVVEVTGGTVSDSTTAELPSTTASDLAENDVEVIWQKDITPDGEELTFTVPGTENKVLYIYRYDGTKWELIGSGMGPSVTVKVPSGPATYAVGVGDPKLPTTNGDEEETKPSAPNTDEDVKLPLTGDSPVVYFAGLFAMLSFAGLVIVGRRIRRNEE